MGKKKKKKIIGWSLVLFLVINVVIFATIPFLVMSPMVDKHVDFKRVWTPEEFDLDAKHFFVQTEDGLHISTYEVMVDSPKVVVVCLSGINNPSATVYFAHARLFKEHGYATVLFDMRAHGESDGNQIGLGYKEFLDTKAVVAYIKQQPLYKDVPIVVMGLSMGGAAAINSIGKIPEIDGLISLSAYSSWEEVFYENMAKTVPRIIADIEYPFVYLTTFLKYGSNSFVKPTTEIQNLGNRPALLMHSRDDSQVAYANFERLQKVAPAHVETFVIAGDRHLIIENFIAPEDDKTYTDRLLTFLKEHFVGNR